MIGASKDNLIKTLADLQPGAHQPARGRRQLAPGLDLMVSFPFPKEAAEVVKGDYANASIRASINLRTLIPPGAPNPIPPIELPDPGQVLTDVQKCLQSGDLTSKACRKVLSRRRPAQEAEEELPQAEEQGQPGLRRSSTRCPTSPALPDLPDLPGLPGLPLLSFNDALSSGRPSPSYSGAALYGGSTS